MTPNDVQRAYVRLTEAAVEDLRHLNRLDPQIVKWAFKKMILLERDPAAGEPLLGALIGYPRIVVGDRDWRIVWRETRDDTGRVSLDIAEVWAVGARSDAQVYAELRERIKAMPDGPRTRSLASVVKELARAAWEIPADEEPSPEPLPDWLVRRLTLTARLPSEVVHQMTLEEAVDAWTSWISSPQSR